MLFAARVTLMTLFSLLCCYRLHRQTYISHHHIWLEYDIQLLFCELSRDVLLFYILPYWCHHIITKSGWALFDLDLVSVAVGQTMSLCVQFCHLTYKAKLFSLSNICQCWSMIAAIYRLYMSTLVDNCPRLLCQPLSAKPWKCLDLSGFAIWLVFHMAQYSLLDLQIIHFAQLFDFMCTFYAHFKIYLH